MSEPLKETPPDADRVTADLSASRHRRTVLIVATALAFVIGSAIWLVLSVYSTQFAKDFLAVLSAVEVPADVKQPNKIERGKFRLHYPGNWTIDTADEEYDPDHYFTIESPGFASISLEFLEEEYDPRDTVDTYIEIYRDVFSKATEEPFTHWGRYSGEGIHIRGRVEGIRAEVKMFCHSAAGQSLIVTEYCQEEDLQDVRPGFKLIEDSFAFTGSKREQQNAPGNDETN